ncbi:hypothetical protein [Rubrimonas cliftonensis]|nr:hypothetical protein [Rubrimonas cliftonensis]
MPLSTERRDGEIPASHGGVVIDLDAVARALDALAAAAPPAWVAGREAFSPEILRWMLDGYALLDDMLASGVDLFALGASHRLIELNHRVLCGTDPARRADFKRHLALTERRFYEDRAAGADAFFDWVSRADRAPPLVWATALYVRVVSAPQLFLEGNQRTATLMASFALVRAGRPPLVVTPEGAPALARISARCRAIPRARWTAPLEIALMERRLRRHLARTLDPVFLRSRHAA